MNIWRIPTNEPDPIETLEIWFQFIVYNRCVTDEQDSKIPGSHCPGIYFWGPRGDHRESLIYRVYCKARDAAKSIPEFKRIYYRYHRMCCATRMNVDTGTFDPMKNHVKPYHGKMRDPVPVKHGSTIKGRML